jgi:serine/threonine protein kinase
MDKVRVKKSTRKLYCYGQFANLFSGVDIDHNCVVMEICQKSLYDIIQSEVHIKFLEFLNWTKQIAEGMEYLHSENVTHRDLKSPKYVTVLL